MRNKNKIVLRYTVWDSGPEALGLLTLCFDEKSLLGIDFGDYLPAGAASECSALSDMVCRQLREYFAGERRSFDLPLRAQGTAFQRAVWEALCRIPYGDTRSYSDIAAAIGRPRAWRAVGLANNRNPLPIVIPCHRVIGKSGALVGYGGGLDIKRRLLALEGVGA